MTTDQSWMCEGAGGEVAKARFAYITDSLEARAGYLIFIMWIPGCHK